MTERCSHCGTEPAKHHQEWVNISEVHTFGKTFTNILKVWKNYSFHLISKRLVVTTVHDGSTIST